MLEIIIIAGLTQSILLGTYFYSYRKKIVGGFLQSILLFTLSFSILIGYFYSSEKIFQFPHFSRLGFLLSSCLGPFIYFSTRSVLYKKEKLQKQDIYFGIVPSGILIYLLPYFFSSTEYKIEYLKVDLVEPHFDCLVISSLSLINNFFCTFLAILLLYKSTNKDELSLKIQNDKKKYLSEFKEIVFRLYQEFLKIKYKNFYYISILIILFIVLILSILDRRVLNSGLYSLFMSVLIIVRSYEILKDNKQFSGLLLSYPPSDKYKKSKINPELERELGEEIKIYFDKEKPFIDPDFSPDIIAEKFNISNHEVSQIFTNYFLMSFSKFTNEYRVREVIETMKRDSNLLHLSMTCGFNSKSRFNSVFKEITGRTPTEFKKSKFS